LRNSDVRVYLNTGKTEERASALQLFDNTFNNQNLTVHVRAHDGTQTTREEKQAGAMEALTRAALLQWFDGYDWVIRVNPDVIVRDDTFLLKTMKNDRNATALLINCDWKQKGIRAHTDFFALKPEALPPFAFVKPSNPNAEYSFTNDIKPILESGGHRWIQDAFSMTKQCQAGKMKAFRKTPITHYHPLNLTDSSYCPIPFS